MQYEVLMDRKFKNVIYHINKFTIVLKNSLYYRKCCGTRIRVEMSSGRSRRDDRKGGDSGGGGRAERHGYNGSGRSRYK